MRLVIVTHNVIPGDGQGRVNVEIAQHALSQGWNVVLVADRVDSVLQARGASWVPIHPRSERLLLFKVWEFAVRADRALDRIRTAGDLVHAWGYTTHRPHQVNGAQFVHHAWGRTACAQTKGHWDLNSFYQDLFTRMNTRWERPAYLQAQRVIAASHRVRSELKQVGVDDQRIRVVWNGSDPMEFRPGTDPSRLSLGLPQEGCLALFAGDIKTRRKNLDTVLKALVSCPCVHLAVVGRKEESPYPAMAERLGIADRVTFLGFRSDIARIMQACDLFVFPSRYEPFGIVVLEAMLTGLPVITATTVGASEMITPEAGLVLPEPEDAEALAQALRALAGDPERRRAMGQTARCIGQRHTWTDMAAAYLQVYREVAP